MQKTDFEEIILPAILLILSVALFLLCTYLVFSGITSTWDRNTFLALNDFLPNSFFSTLMIDFSLYGREVVFTGAFFILAFSRKASHRRAAFYLFLTFVALLILGPIVQFSLFRDRPIVTLKDVSHFILPPLGLPSFPSGHSYGVAGLTAVLWLSLRKDRKLLYLLTVDAAFVCFSRVYVGAHYPMDVIAGIFFGIAVASGIMVFQRKLDPIFQKLDVYWRAKLVSHVEETGENIGSKEKKASL